jgi:hypothetical protein
MDEVTCYQEMSDRLRFAVVNLGRGCAICEIVEWGLPSSYFPHLW